MSAEYNVTTSSTLFTTPLVQSTSFGYKHCSSIFLYNSLFFHVLILDVRAKEDYEADHIFKAIHLDIDLDTNQDQDKDKDRGKDENKTDDDKESKEIDGAKSKEKSEIGMIVYGDKNTRNETYTRVYEITQRQLETEMNGKGVLADKQKYKDMFYILSDDYGTFKCLYPFLCQKPTHSPYLKESRREEQAYDKSIERQDD
ncbi:hypothetical protein RFI_04378, partial [Reticulomyxa filosa]